MSVPCPGTARQFPHGVGGTLSPLPPGISGGGVYYIRAVSPTEFQEPSGLVCPHVSRWVIAASILQWRQESHPRWFGGRKLLMLFRLGVWRRTVAGRPHTATATREESKNRTARCGGDASLVLPCQYSWGSSR